MCGWYLAPLRVVLHQLYRRCGGLRVFVFLFVFVFVIAVLVVSGLVACGDNHTVQACSEKWNGFFVVVSE